MALSDQKIQDFLDDKESTFDPAKIEDHLSAAKPELQKRPIGTTGLDDLWRMMGEWGAGGSEEVLNLAGMPADIGNWVAEKIGLGRPIMGGSEQLRTAAAKHGIGYAPGNEPDTAPYKAGQYTGMGLEFMAPILRAGRGATEATMMGKDVLPATGVARGVAEKITSPFVTDPLKSMAAELGASTASGVGAYYGGKEAGPMGEMLGGLAGIPAGFLPFVGPRAYDVIKRNVFAFTPAGARSKAGQRLRELSETEGVLPTLEKTQQEVIPGAIIPTGKMTGDKHIIAMQKKLIEANPKLSHELALQESAVNKMARDEVDQLGGNIPIEETQAYLQGRVNKITNLLDRRVDMALEQSKQQLESLAPTTERATVNSIVSKNIKQALSEARGVEAEAWNKVNKSASAGTATVKDTFSSILKERTRTSDPSEIPDFLYKELGRLKDGALSGGKMGSTDKVGVLQDMRHRLGNLAREEKAKDVPNWNKVRILEDMNDAILEDLAGSSTGADYDAALAISRDLNKRFRGGIMDIVLGHERAGGATEPTQAIQSLGFGKKMGPKTAVEMKRIMEASPESAPMLEEYVKNNMKYLNKDGALSLGPAKNFFRDNEEVLNLFPNLKNQLQSSIAAEDKALQTILIMKGRKQRINTSLAAKMAKKDNPDTVISAVLKMREPKAQMKRLVSQSDDKARQGIKRGIADYLLENSKVRLSEEDSMPILSGTKMDHIWKTEGEVLKQGLSGNDVNRLKQIITTLKANETPSTLPDIGEAVPPGNLIMKTLMSFQAARMGAKIGQGTGGASMKTAALAVKVQNQIYDKLNVGKAQQLLTDAIQDPELFRALYRDTSKPENLAKSWKTVQGWMIAHELEMYNKSE